MFRHGDSRKSSYKGREQMFRGLHNLFMNVVHNHATLDSINELFIIINVLHLLISHHHHHHRLTELILSDRANVVFNFHKNSINIT